MVWNAASQRHEATIPLPIGTHEFKLFLPLIDIQMRFSSLTHCCIFQVLGRWPVALL